MYIVLVLVVVVVVDVVCVVVDVVVVDVVDEVVTAVVVKRSLMLNVVVVYPRGTTCILTYLMSSTVYETLSVVRAFPTRYNWISISCQPIPSFLTVGLLLGNL